MSQTNVGAHSERELPDYLDIVANVGYALTAALFLGGLWMDWQAPGDAVIPMFALADEPQANSGLIILAVLILAVSYLVSLAARKIVEYQTEDVDETQEWIVDVGE
jgi:hypothetical protein